MCPLPVCEFLVARTGSIVMSAAPAVSFGQCICPVHICIAYANQLVYDVREALVWDREKCGNQLPSLITLATGPSQQPILKTLVWWAFTARKKSTFSGGIIGRMRNIIGTFRPR